MKADSRSHMSWGSRLRFLVRLVGITAVLVAGAGAMYLSTVLDDWQSSKLAAALKNELGAPAMIGASLLFIGGLAAVFALVVEILAGLTGSASSRGAAGAGAVFQIVIAIGIVVALNLYAFHHEADFDLTRTKEFTLPASVVGELQKLNSETTIVVLQQHKTFGRLTDKPDRFDYAAERKVVEKVQDTVDLFRKFSPLFKVVVLDVEQEGYDKKVDELTKNNPKLRAAIDAAPENSIFFSSERKVQRMSFNEFYQLDKHASKEANGNLVLYPQGIENLVKRITAIEEKRPKVAIAVTHPYLSTQKKKGSGADAFTLAGLRKSFTDYGFDVVDVVLKKNFVRELEGDPASYTTQETAVLELEEKLEVAKQDLKLNKRILEGLEPLDKKVKAAAQKPPAERVAVYLDALARLTGRGIADDPERLKKEPLFTQFENLVLNTFDKAMKEQKFELEDSEVRVRDLTNDYKEALKQERSIEDRYLTDVKAKFTRLLDDCDLLIVPRMTIMNAARGEVLPRFLHKLDKSQVDVIKQFMKAGKPVLVCSGPVNITQLEPLPPTFDDLEALLNERGVELSKQTVLFNVESETFRDVTEQQEELNDTTAEVPPLTFVAPESWLKDHKKPNPIAQAMEVLVNSVDQPLDVRVRAPRPVTLSTFAQDDQPFLAEFLWTSPRSWSENYPFNYAIRNQVNPFTMQPQRVPVQMTRPRFDANADGKAAGRGEPERRGPLSIAVAVDAPLPPHWYTDKDAGVDRNQKNRLVVIGQGSIFNGPELAPGTEKLLLVTSNWLLKREDRLPHAADLRAANAADRPWEYPRVKMSEGRKALWHWGASVGLPLLFVYFGLIVLMLRRVR
jgi:hypothetical protein